MGDWRTSEELPGEGWMEVQGCGHCRRPLDDHSPGCPKQN